MIATLTVKDHFWLILWGVGLMVGVVSSFFCVHCRGSYESYHTECTTRGAGDKMAGEGRTKQWGTETLDLGKGEEWDGVNGVNKMDTTGTFRTLHDRELSGRKSGNLKELGLGVDKRGKKILWMWMGGDQRWC